MRCDLKKFTVAIDKGDGRLSALYHGETVLETKNGKTYVVEAETREKAIDIAEQKFKQEHRVRR